MTKVYTIADLLEIMAALRMPTTGCPWDIDQTFETIIPYTIEEAYEVADAIERHDMSDLKEELGDLLLQVVYHAQMAEEEKIFTFHDVTQIICEKMIRRHPHVFGSEKQRSEGVTEGFWERIKQQEKSQKSDETKNSEILNESRLPSSSSDLSSAHNLRDVPLALPALTRAVKLQKKAAQVGFDWPSLAPVFEKMREELLELETEISKATTQDKIEEEFGDLLFVMANVARHLKLDPEQALRKANHKFTRRFMGIEEKLHDMGKRTDQSSLEEMDALWDEVKREEKA